MTSLRQQAQEDEKGHVTGAPKVSGVGGSIDEQISELVNYVIWNIQQDRKIPSLKELQGHIWRSGYESGQIQSIVYDDVPVFLSRMHEVNVKVSIYSSGSREAQRLLFKYSNHGDLRSYLNAYFDTSIGHKRTSSSYREIALSLGVDNPEEVLFVTDILEEAQSAKDAGLSTILSVRPGNYPLPANHGYKAVTSFDQI